MQKTRLYLFLLSAAAIAAVIAMGPYWGAGKLFAMQQGTTSPGNVTTAPNTTDNNSSNNAPNNPSNNPPNSPSSCNYAGSGSDTSQQNAGQTPTGPGSYYRQGSQANSDVGRAGAPWGWIIGSFIAGLIVGGLAFRRTVYRDRIDRTDFRRSA